MPRLQQSERANTKLPAEGAAMPPPNLRERIEFVPGEC